MRLEAERDNLLAAVAMVCGVVPSKPVKEELGFLRLKCPGLFDAAVHGTDLEIHLEAGISLLILEGPGEVLLPAHQLLAVLRLLPEGPVHLEMMGSECVIRSGEVEYRLETGKTETLPDMPVCKDPWKLLVSGGRLRQAFRRVSYAASTDAARFSMNGVRLRFNLPNLQTIATDGRRLAVAELDLKQDDDWDNSLSNPPKVPLKIDGVTVPHKAVDVIERVGHERAVFSWDRNTMTVAWLDETGKAVVSMSTLLIEGKYPDIDAVWPKGKPATQFEHQADELVQAVRRAAVCADQEARRLEMNIQPKGITLTARGVGRGQAVVQVPAQVKGESMTVTVNPAYLMDVLRHAGESAGVSCTGVGQPVQIGGQGYMALLMPLT